MSRREASASLDEPGEDETTEPLVSAEAEEEDSSLLQEPESPHCDGEDEPTVDDEEAVPAWQIFPEDRNLLYIATNDHDEPKKSRHDNATKLHIEMTLYISPVHVPSSQTASVAVEQPKLSPLEVYQQVHGSVVRLQKFTRGYLTRRRFFRMLEELVMKS
ncbi:uncharacterized protein IUM83_01407 [Globisporangium polare]